MFFLRSSSSVHYRTHLRDVLSSTPPTTKLEMAKRHTCNSSKVSEMFKPWEPTTFIFWGYNPYFGGVKPSFFMVLGSKGSYYQKAHSAIRTQHVFFFRNKIQVSHPTTGPYCCRFSPFSSGFSVRNPKKNGPCIA